MKRSLIDLNSLTDIISNSVGVLVMFAVLNLVQERDKVYPLEVPIEHSSRLAPVFFICKQDKVLFLDPDKVFVNAIIKAGEGASQGGAHFSLGYHQLNGQIDQQSGHGLIFHPDDTRQWYRAADLEEPDSELRRILDGMDGAKQFGYFFVYDQPVEGEGFAIFRSVRRYLQARNVTVGWRPSDQQNPAFLCFWDDVAACKNYRPSFSASNPPTGQPAAVQ